MLSSFLGRPRVARRDWHPRREGGWRTRTQGKSKRPNVCISSQSVETLQLSPNHESVLRGILEQQECLVYQACLGRTEHPGKRWVHNHVPQYALCKYCNADMCVCLFRVKQVLQVQGGWRGYLE